MQKEKQSVPRLRFPEFDGEWVKKTLFDISKEVAYGMNSSAIRYDGENKYLRITDIDESSRKFVPNPLSSPDGKIETKYILKKGDIVFARTGASVGKSYLYDEKDGKLLYAGFLIKFHIINSNPYFVYLQTFRESYNKWVHVYSMRSGQPGLNAEEYKLLKINLPQLKEQQKIANFLAAVDNQIQTIEKKKTLLEQYKKGVMQKIFKQELRFKDDDGHAFPEWQFKNGNLLFKSISDKNHNSDLPILAITQDQGAIPRHLINYNIGVSEKSVDSYKVVQVGDFIISLRSFQGGIEYSNYKGICSPAYIILKPIKEMDRNFYKYYLKTPSYIQELTRKLEGIRDGKMISYKYFSEIKLPYPSLQEQTKIANFLSAIDKNIELVNTKIEHTKSYKKGLLQQMFV
jgi:type I restriction enzyme S subunit